MPEDTPKRKPKPLEAVSTHRAEPVVDRFVSTDLPLSTILVEVPEPRSILVQALLHIHDCLDGNRLAKEAMELAQAVPLQGWDPDLLKLFLSGWAELSCRIGRPSAATTLIHQARALVTETTHPEVLANIMLVESNLADATGNKAKCEENLKKALQTVSSHSARRKLYVWELALFLALQGRGVESREALKELSLQSNDRFRTSRLLIVQFVDAVETGRIQDASEYMSQLQTGLHNPRDMTRFPYKAYQELLGIMHASSPASPAGQASHDAPPPRPRMAVIQALLQNKTEEALSRARTEANRVLSSIFAAGFESFNLVRAELAAGNAESASRLIRMRQGRGNSHYLDELFLCRAEHLQGNTRAACNHFAELARTIEFYHAKGRLDFELRLSTELSHGDIMRLSQEGERHRKRSLGVFTLRNAAGDEISSKSLKRQALPSSDKTHETPSSLDDVAKMGVNVIRGRSSAAQEIRQSVTRYADLDAPVLITGETGTGKELVAQALHVASSRRNEPLTIINCGAITESLLESELFGHEKGAFTGAERANKGLFEATGNGTILLDEIGDISARLQGTLLRVIETGEIRAVGSTKTRKISCRIVTATNVDLEQAAQEGLFRADLIYRLQRLGIHLPPLRERRDDILVLARHFLDSGRRIGIHAVLSDAVRTALRDYDWPGNIRELHNVIERMRLMHSDKLSYDIADLDIRFQPGQADKADTREGGAERPRAQIRPRARRAGDRAPSIPRFGEHSAEPGPAIVKQSDTVPPAPSQERSATHTHDQEIDRILSAGTSSMRRLEKLRAIFVKHKRLTRKEVIQILEVSPNTATKYLQDLADEGFIHIVSPNGSTRTRFFEHKAASPESD